MTGHPDYDVSFVDPEVLGAALVDHIAKRRRTPVTIADLAAFASRYLTRAQRTQLVVRP